MKAKSKKMVIGCLGGILSFAMLLGICSFTGILELWLPGRQMAKVPTVTVVEPGKELEEGVEAAPEELAEEIHLLFAGDLFLTELLQEKYQHRGIEAAATPRLLETLEAADVFMLNQEFPFGTTGEAMEDKTFTFRIHPDYVRVLQELSVDMVTLANNHMLDFGREPLAETFATLNTAGIPYVGAGESLEEASCLKTLEVKGKTIGFLGASRVIPESSWAATRYQSGVFTTYDPSLLLEKIREAKDICDFLVVYVHWGVERSPEPEEYQENLARQYVDAGADAVIGSHPHILQEMEYYEGKPIFYSLGNFIFSNSEYETAMVELILTDEGVKTSWIPCVSTGNQMDLKESG